jgi:hypothetical protein
VEETFYDPSSIASRCKREQYLKEAEKHNLLRQIAIDRKHTKQEKEKLLADPSGFFIPIIDQGFGEPFSFDGWQIPSPQTNQIGRGSKYSTNKRSRVRLLR